MTSESRTTFFKQSGWLAFANSSSGVFLIAVYALIGRLPTVEFGIFTSLLRLFVVLAIPAAGLQIVLAQEAAAALTEEDKRALRVTINRIFRVIFSAWLVICVICFWQQDELVAAFKLRNSWALWITLVMALVQLSMPIAHGLLQGAQNFSVLGFSIFLIGFGRFAGIAAMVLIFNAHATGALFGALAGLISAVAVGFWPSRSWLHSEHGSFDWSGWLRRLAPLTAATGSTLFLMNADILFVQSHFAKEDAPFYSAAAIVGVGLVAFTTPLAAVMFPKIVRSVAKAEPSNALALALGGTAVLGGAGALVCTAWPELPLRIMYFNKPEFLRSAALVPWFMWGMLPVTIANVLISHLLAKRDFKAVPWLVAVAAGYGIALWRAVQNEAGLEPMLAFQRVVQTLGIFSLLLLGVAALFTWLSRDKRAV